MDQSPIDKQAVKDCCLKQLTDKIVLIQHELEQSRAGAEDHAKSSAGDKHETGRAMAQLEQERLGLQLEQLNQQKAQLERIDATKVCQQAEHGAYVTTTAGDFFLSTGLGLVKEGAILCYAIHLQSPVGQQLLGKGPDDAITMGDRKATILRVY